MAATRIRLLIRELRLNSDNLPMAAIKTIHLLPPSLKPIGKRRLVCEVNILPKMALLAVLLDLLLPVV